MIRRSLLLLPIALAGCSASSLLAPSGEPAKLYTLSAPDEVAISAAQANWQLLIAMPDAALDINISRIAIAPTPDRIDYYANVAWADRPPAMLQEILLQSFDKSGRIAAVGRQSGGLKADFILSTDLQDFEVETGHGDPCVHLRITARLVRTRDRAIVATRSFDAAPPASGSFDGAIAGFDSAVAQLLPEIVGWTLTEGNRNL
jgi:cholesterol transport system auxiliary component